MDRKQIENREDVFLLVNSFYKKIKVDEIIGEFFIKTIPANEWDSHIQKLTDFWETNLFFVRKFKGNPIKAHRDVDTNFNQTIQQEHFGRWLELWFSTVDEYFYGEKANQAKERARNIASMLFFKIYENRLK
ncbi:MAG: group III truncated hemoglobin [Tenacibaculum sp.]|nr:group III truncated hemoglobin [Tenacibaculum sp.]